MSKNKQEVKKDEKFVINYSFERLIDMSVEGNPKSKKVKKEDKNLQVKA